VFTLGLFNKFPFFRVQNADKRIKKLCPLYLDLCKLSSSLINSCRVDEMKNLIEEFWQSMFISNIDSNGPGIMGDVQDLFALFEPLTILRPFYSEIHYCEFCKFNNTTKSRFPIPLKIHDLDDLNFDSVQKYFDWFFMKTRETHCEICLQKDLIIDKQIEKNQIFFILNLLFKTRSRGNFIFNDVLVDMETQNKYELVATINNPTPNHFNCSIYEPQLQEKVLLKGKWILHDGLKNQGKLETVNNINEIWNQNPIFLMYHKVD